MKTYKHNYLNKTETMVNRETGELQSGVFIPAELTNEVKIIPISTLNAFKKKAEANTDLKYFNSIVGGSFTFSIEHSVRKLFNDDNFSDAEKVHIMYLGSFVNYRGYLMTKNNLPITKKLLQGKVKIRNKKRFYEFYNKLLSFGFINEFDEKLYWSKGLCFKGSPKTNGTSSQKVIRTYDDTIQRLYEAHQPKSMAIIFKLIPYLNKFHNVLCRKTGETEYDSCLPYNVREIAALLGENDNKNLKQKLLRLRLGDEYIFSIRHTGNNSTIIVNPSLVWLSSYPPSSNLVGDFSLAKAKLLRPVV